MSLKRQGRILAALSGCLLAAMAVAVVLIVGSPPGRARAATPLVDLITCNGVQLPIVGGLSLGGAIGGLPLGGSSKLCNPASPGGPETVPFTSVVYGTCTATSEEGCGFPLEIQTWRECDRNLSRYTITGPDGQQQAYPYDLSTLAQARQIPVATFDDGTRIEIYTGTATIVIFSEDPTLMQQALTTVGSLAAAVTSAGASDLLSAANGGVTC